MDALQIGNSASEGPMKADLPVGSFSPGGVRIIGLLSTLDQRFTNVLVRLRGDESD